MMHSFLKFAVAVFTISMFCGNLQAKPNEEQPVYAFGYSVNFNDSTLFLSPIQILPNANIAKRTGFLEHRDVYSHQLKAHLESIYPGHETCTVFFSRKKDALEKKYIKLRRHLLLQKRNKLIELSNKDFHFQPVVVEDTTK